MSGPAVHAFVREFFAGGFCRLSLSVTGRILVPSRQGGVDMETKRKSLWSLLNPLEWLSAIFGPILRFFGMLSPPPTGGFENISTAAVEAAAAHATTPDATVGSITPQKSQYRKKVRRGK